MIEADDDDGHEVGIEMKIGGKESVSRYENWKHGLQQFELITIKIGFECGPFVQPFPAPFARI